MTGLAMIIRRELQLALHIGLGFLHRFAGSLVSLLSLRQLGLRRLDPRLGGACSGS